MRALILALPLALVAACGQTRGEADIERSLFNAELQASSTLQQRYAALVQLYKALGGGWEQP